MRHCARCATSGSSATDRRKAVRTLFEAAIKADIISAQDVMQRIRLALEAGNISLAKTAGAIAAERQRLPLAELEWPPANPQRYLNKTVCDGGDGRRSVALLALQRLSRQSVNCRAERSGRRSHPISPKTERRYFFTWLAYSAAQEHDARALGWYAEVGEGALNDQQLAWRARAALRAQNWHEVWASIAAMAPEQQNDGAWRYWKARALKELGRVDDAEAILTPLSREYNFYGQLAAEELGAAPAAGISRSSFQPTADRRSKPCRPSRTCSAR